MNKRLTEIIDNEYGADAELDCGRANPLYDLFHEFVSTDMYNNHETDIRDTIIGVERSAFEAGFLRGILAVKGGAV